MTKPSNDLFGSDVLVARADGGGKIAAAEAEA